MHVTCPATPSNALEPDATNFTVFSATPAKFPTIPPIYSAGDPVAVVKWCGGQGGRRSDPGCPGRGNRCPPIIPKPCPNDGVSPGSVWWTGAAAGGLGAGWYCGVRVTLAGRGRLVASVGRIVFASSSSWACSRAAKIASSIPRAPEDSCFWEIITTFCSSSKGKLETCEKTESRTCPGWINE